MTHNNLEVKRITKHYKNKRNANNDISITFKTHEITALIGHNGAGKTTLLNQISGLIVPTEGQVLMNHIDISQKQSIASTRVSSMPQFQAPLKGVTLLQAIQSIAMIKGFSRKEAKAKAVAIITKLQLEKWKDIPGEKLSGGLQRLTSFAMSVVVPTPVIILDEPTNDVDPIRRSLMWKYLQELAAQGTIVIIVTHNLLEVEKYADRYILLDNGCVKKDVTITSGYVSDKRHMLSLYGIEEADTTRLARVFDTRYVQEKRTLFVSLQEQEIAQAINMVTELLHNQQATNYDLKLESLYEQYEEMIDEAPYSAGQSATQRGDNT